jgi:hypothetical protein
MLCKTVYKYIIYDLITKNISYKIEIMNVCSVLYFAVSHFLSLSPKLKLIYTFCKYSWEIVLLQMIKNSVITKL